MPLHSEVGVMFRAAETNLRAPSEDERARTSRIQQALLQISIATRLALGQIFEEIEDLKRLLTKVGR